MARALLSRIHGIDSPLTYGACSAQLDRVSGETARGGTAAAEADRSHGALTAHTLTFHTVRCPHVGVQAIRSVTSNF